MHNIINGKENTIKVSALPHLATITAKTLLQQRVS